VNDLPPHKKGTHLRYSAGHFVKSIHEAPDTEMLDIGDHWGFSMPSVSIYLRAEDFDTTAHEIAMLLAPFDGASSNHLLCRW